LTLLGGFNDTRSNKKYCVNCLEEATALRLRCAECADMELCLECFSAGAELGPHRRWHSYQMVLQQPACGPGWSNCEEQLLLEAVEQYGFGNWEDVAAHVGSRTAAEATEHYLGRFVYVMDVFGQTMLDTKAADGSAENSIVVPYFYSIVVPYFHCCTLLLSPAERQQLGYLPLRDDFEVEHDPEAEGLISGLALSYSDDELDLELKRACVDMYVRRVEERQRRKQIVREYNLIAGFLGKERDRGPKGRPPSKEETELRGRMQPFCRFLPAHKLDEMMESGSRERGLRLRVRELQRYRCDGITRLEESAEYEAAKHRREKRKAGRPPTPTTRQSGRPPTPNTRLGALALRWVLRGAGVKAVALPLRPVLNPNKEQPDGDAPTLENLPGFQELSEQERLLCTSLGLSPTRYVTIKAILIRDYLQKRQGIPSKPRLPPYLDKSHKKRILSFLTKSGWIARE
uniref:Transcriptional adapter n=1 Tax=Petromyzon marinus TaxID=7757 RepID=S4R4A9_PETMA